MVKCLRYFLFRKDNILYLQDYDTDERSLLGRLILYIQKLFLLYINIGIASYSAIVDIAILLYKIETV